MLQSCRQHAIQFGSTLSRPRHCPRPVFWHALSRSFSSQTSLVRQNPACIASLIRRRTVNARWRPSRTLASAAGLPSVMINDLKSQEILVDFNDGRATRYPSIWLRDHCPCSECTHPQTGQRQIDVLDLGPDVKATSALSTPAGLEVTWSDSGHVSTYAWSWLQQHEPFAAKSRTAHPRSNWQHVSPSSGGLPSVDFESVMKTDVGLANLLSQIRIYGLSLVHGTPSTTEATEALLNRIAFIRHTHYGGFWDFTTIPNPVDTAWTNLALPLHTDTTYFTEPCGLQLFHVLQPATDGGGQSTFTDGFAAAQHFYKTYPTFYQSLSSVPIISHASGDSNAGSILNTSSLPAGFPVFNHATPLQPALYKPGNLTQIRWNNGDRHSSTVWPSHQAMTTWYTAARAWTHLIATPEFQWQVQLVPGVPVIFDNWRVLHGRRAFEGKRRVCGAYIGMDDFLAKARLLDERVVEG